MLHGKDAHLTGEPPPPPTPGTIIDGYRRGQAEWQAELASDSRADGPVKARASPTTTDRCACR